jgi:hypothetical protein
LGKGTGFRAFLPQLTRQFLPGYFQSRLAALLSTSVERLQWKEELIVIGAQRSVRRSVNER